jgi:hypothetical protein
MNRRTMILLTLIFCAALPVQAQEQGSQRKVSLRLQRVPLRQALQLLFENAGVSFAIDPEVHDTPVTLNVKDVDFTQALRTLVRLGSSAEQAVTYEQVGGAYHVQARKPELPSQAPEGEAWEKIPVQFLRAQDVLAQLGTTSLPLGISGVLAMPVDNSLLVRGKVDSISDLKNIMRLIDVPSKTLALGVGVRGPGPDGRPVELQSQARTIRGQNVTIDDQARVSGHPARLKVQLRPVLQGDGAIVVESDWDVSLPLAGGARGPFQFVKRLTTSTLVLPGQDVTVGQVDLAGWGGKGVLRLWIRANLLPDRPPAAFPRAGK